MKLQKTAFYSMIQLLTMTSTALGGGADASSYGPPAPAGFAEQVSEPKTSASTNNDSEKASVSAQRELAPSQRVLPNPNTELTADPQAQPQTQASAAQSAPQTSWWSQLKSKVSEKLAELKNSFSKEKDSSKVTAASQKDENAAGQLVGRRALVGTAEEMVVSQVQTQPALVITKSDITVRALPIPELNLRPKKQPLAVESAGQPLEEIARRSRYSLKEASSEIKIPEHALKITSAVKNLPEQKLLSYDPTTDDGYKFIKALFSVLYSRFDEATEAFHSLALQSKAALIRTKSFSFTGWILEEQSFARLAGLAFVKALSATPASAESLKYDNESLLSLSKLARSSVAAKSWLPVEIAQKLLETPKIKPEALALLSMALAERAFDQKSFAAARRHSQAVPEKSTWKEHARYLAAMSIVAQKESPQNYETAGKELTNLFRSVEDPVVFDATAVSLGRIHFILGNYKAAHQYLTQVSRETNLYIESAIDNAWALLRSGDRNHAVGNMFTLHTPYFEGAYMPESYFIQSLGYQEICQFGDALTAVKQYKTRYYDALKKMVDFNASGKTPEKAYYDQLASYLGRKDYQVPEVVLRELGRHPEFLKRQKEMNSFSREERTVAEKFPKSALALTTWAKPSFDQLRGSYGQEINRFLKAKALSIEEDLRFLTSNIALLEYEIFAGAGRNLALQGAQNFQVDEKAVPKRDFDAAKEYWPYEDEIWEDELNNFRSKMVDACAKVKKQG
ncbi:MAG: hypothetical protein AB1540_06430 [Bdellovibrionota bacterium]